MKDVFVIYLIMLLSAYCAMVLIFLIQLISLLVLGWVVWMCFFYKHEQMRRTGSLLWGVFVYRMVAVPCLVFLKYGVDLLVDYDCLFNRNPTAGPHYTIFYGALLYLFLIFPSGILYGSVVECTSKGYRWLLMVESVLTSLLYVWIGDALMRSIT